MITIKDKIIAFKRDGELVIFESRAEFNATDLKEANINLLFATSGDLYRRFLELEDKEKDNENEVMTSDNLSQYNGMMREAEREQLGSENAVRAKKAQEDGSQRKMWGVV